MRHVVYLLANAVIVGVLVVGVILAGWIGYVPIFGAIVLGSILAWPVALVVVRGMGMETPQPPANPPAPPARKQ